MKIMYTSLTIISTLLIVLTFGGISENSVNTIEFLQLFIYVSLPFILACTLGWRKGFLFSLLISTIVLLVTILTQGTGQDVDFIYSVFFASFSLFYLLIAFVISFFNKKS